MFYDFGGFVAAAVFLYLGLPYLREAIRTRRQLRLFQGTPRTPIQRIRGGLCRLSGRIETEGAWLESPLSKRCCVFYEFLVYTPQTTQYGSDKPIVHVHDRQCAPCYVNDGTGKVDLDLSAATRHCNVDRHERSGSGLFQRGALFGKTLTPELDETLRRYGMKPRRGQVLHYEEILIEPGETLSVLGTAICEKGHRPAIVEQVPDPLIVAESDDDLISRFRAEIGSGVGAGIVFCLLAVPFFLFALYNVTTVTLSSWANNRIVAVQRSEDIGKLVAHLQGDDPLLQVTAANRLKDFGPKAREAIPALEQMLGEEDATVQGAAVAALASIGKEAVPGLLGALRSSRLSSLHVAIANELAKLGPDAEAAMPALADALDESNPIALRRAAATALLRIDPVHHGGRKAKVAQILADRPQRPKSPVEENIAALNDTLAYHRANAALKLGSLGAISSPALPALIELLHDDPNSHVRESAARAIGQIAPFVKDQRPTLFDEALTALVEGLKDRQVRRGAAQGLGRLGPDAQLAVPALIETIQTEPWNDGVREAREAIVAIGPMAIPALAEVIESDSRGAEGRAGRQLRRALEEIEQKRR